MNKIKNKILTTLILANREINQKNIDGLKEQILDVLINLKLKEIELEKYDFNLDKYELDRYLKQIDPGGLKEIEKKFNQKVVTYVRKFEIFYKAEEHHQDYYKEKFLNYLLYKEGCGRQRKLDNIWQ